MITMASRRLTGQFALPRSAQTASQLPHGALHTSTELLLVNWPQPKMAVKSFRVATLGY